MSADHAVLDDLESRPGSTTALLRTVVGAVMRDQGGWLSTAALVALMDAVGVPAGRARTALTRLKAKGLFHASIRGSVPGYALTPGAVAMLNRGDRRIYHPRAMAAGDRWCLISFSVPEERRDLRHQLRRRLGNIGCGTVASGLWIVPEYLADEVEGIVGDLGLARQVTIFLTDEVRGAGRLQDAVASWWDLTAIGRRHEEFLRCHDAELAAYTADADPRTAFRAWIRVLDAWRPIPYLDPGLPPSLLPQEWPGVRSIPVFEDSRDRLAAPAAAFARSVAAGPGGGNDAPATELPVAAGKDGSA